MSAQEPAAVLVVESDADAPHVLGPVLPADPAACLSCWAQRRRESTLPLGKFRLVPLNAAQAERLQGSHLWGRQWPAGGDAERWVCAREPGHRCPLDDRALPLLTLDDAVGLRLGLLSRVEDAVWVPGQVTCVAVGSTAVGSAGVPLSVSGTATAPDALMARRLAVCEALEHHAAGFWCADDIVSAPPSDDSVHGLGPWVRAHTWGSGQSVWVPASRVYMPFPDGLGGLAGHSEGLACGISLNDARQRAVAELLERRAVNLLWSSLTPCLLDGSAGQPSADRSWDGVIARSMGVSVAVSLHAAKVGPPYGFVGFGGDVSDELALDKARREAVHVLAHMRRCATLAGAVNFDTKSIMDQRLLALAFQPGHAQDWIDRLSEWANCGSVLPELALDDQDAVAWRDITTPELHRLGLWVVRAVWLDFKGR